MGHADAPWHGYVNQIIYGLDLRTPADDEVVERIAAELFRQRIFASPVERYYDAAVACLRSDERIAFDDERQDDSNVRDLLARLVLRLDEQRPWPVHPFYEVNPSEWSQWSDLLDAPAIARVPLSPREISARLHRVFRAIQVDGAAVHVMVLRLRTGQLVVLRSIAGYTRPGVDLLAHTDAGSTAAAFRELTGLDTGSADSGVWFNSG